MTRTTWPAHYLDGQSAVRHPATARLMREGLEVTLADGSARFWPYREIRQTLGAYEGEAVRLERRGGPGEALVIDDRGALASLAEVAAEAGHGFGGPRPRGWRVGGTVAAGLGAIGLAAALYLWGIPGVAGLLAAWVPAGWEQELGRRAVGVLVPAGQRCVDAGREAALAAIVERLAAVAPPLPYRLQVIVADQPAPNAFAAPGGFIVLYRGLVARLATPEEMAAVLAHEIPHVARRHATRHLIQHASTGLLLAVVIGDVAGPLAYGAEAARLLGALSHSRAAEEEADREGLRLLAAARIDPAAMIAVLEGMLAEEGRTPGALRYLSTHPATEDRIARLRALAAATPVRGEPLMSAEAWTDARRICQGRRPAP